MEIHHIGYLVKNMNKAVSAFEALGYDLTTPPTWDDARKAHLCFMTCGGVLLCGAYNAAARKRALSAA